MHRVAGLDDLFDLEGVAVDQRNLTRIPKGDRHQVFDVDIVHLFGRAIFRRNDHFPGFHHVRHTPFGRRRRIDQHVAGHQVDLFGRQLVGGAPVGHPGGGAVGDEIMNVFVAVLAGDVGGQRLAGRAFAQHAVAPGAAFEVDLPPGFEFFRRHQRIVGAKVRDILKPELTNRWNRRCDLGLDRAQPD